MKILKFNLQLLCRIKVVYLVDVFMMLDLSTGPKYVRLNWYKNYA